MANNGEKNRWSINRAGLVNFWCYDDEAFEFEDGNILLRGANGSGKSVTMQSFVPLLLDGNKSPERLDPFGSRARKIENYLIGENDSSKQESTGYLYMEFKKKESKNFITIGMGLHAKRGKALSSWGFIINDGRRIGKDFELVKKSGGRVPLTKRELKNRIAEGGQVFESQKDYMDGVNRHLFGFDSIDDYDELIKLLIQIRTPKLSKEFKPTVIYDIMNNSLQPLSDEDLRPMSEAIENMDSIKGKLDELKLNRKAAQKLKRAYDQYNIYVALEKAKDFAKSKSKLERLKEETSELERQRHGLLDVAEFEKRNLESLELKRETLEAKKRELEKHDSYELRERASRLEADMKRLEGEKGSKEKLLDEKKSKRIAMDGEITDIKASRESFKNDISRRLLEMDDIAREFDFDEHSFMKGEIEKAFEEEYDFSFVENQLNVQCQKIHDAKIALQQQEGDIREYDRLLENFDRISGEQEQKEKKLDECALLFSEVKGEFVDDAHSWEKGNTYIKIPDAVMGEIAQMVQGYGEKFSYNEIFECMRGAYEDVRIRISKKKESALARLDGIRDNIGEKNGQIENWKQMKEPQMPLGDEVRENIRRLKELEIPHIPLYRAIDFEEGLAEHDMGIIEEALESMGLLDALIIPDEYKVEALAVQEGMAGKYVFSSQSHAFKSRDKRIKADESLGGIIPSEIVDGLIGSIMEGNEESISFVDESGRYGIGPVEGAISKRVNARYIGSSARERFRQENIKRLESERDVLELLEKEVSLDIARRDELLKSIENEKDSFPGGADMDVAHKAIIAAGIELEVAQAAYEKAHAEEQYGMKRLQKSKKEVYEKTRNIQIPVNLDSYEEAVQSAREYESELSKVEVLHSKLMGAVCDISRVSNQIEDIGADIDNLAYDFGEIERKLKWCRENIKSLNEQLELSGFEDVQKEIAQCIKELSDIPERIKDSVGKRARAAEGAKGIGEKIDANTGDIVFAQALCGIHEKGFASEINLGYVGETLSEDGLFERAGSMIKRLEGEMMSQRGMNEHIKNIQEKYHDVKQYMAEYALKIDNMFTPENEYEDERLQKAAKAQERLEIQGMVGGRYIGFYDVVKHIDYQIEENDKLFKDSDRHIFEDILAKNISRKIRAKIYHSESWVKKMNSLMQSMNTSSGLSFSLAWKSRGAQDEEQMDSSDLVEILKKDGALLLDSELERLSAHFRSKIDQVRRSIEESGQHQTFHSIMKDVLDYRKWFEFRLYYRKTNENKRELTNNAFYRFSGGEKAMAMYVPLFSAVYAKYKGARNDCPRIISLDEAFAGVDENNIRDMFRLLGELELEFIINSQVLWGDYDTVDSLAICELLRPDNADFVTVLRYRWNGIQREIVDNETQ